MERDELTCYLKYWGQLNKETKRHSLNVAEICSDLAKTFNLDSDMAYKIGYLHDIGKIYIPSRILRKNCGLVPIEREIIDLHSYIGYQLLRELGTSPDIYIPVLYHHGFNKHTLCTINESVAGYDTLSFIRLVHAVDIYEARKSKRSYHNKTDTSLIINDMKKDWLCNERILNAIEEYDKKTILFDKK